MSNRCKFGHFTFSIHSCIFIIFFSSDSIFNGISKSKFFSSTFTATGTSAFLWILNTINKFLRCEYWSGTISRNSYTGFESFSSRESPTRSTTSLVLNFWYNTMFSPINWIREIFKGYFLFSKVFFGLFTDSDFMSFVHRHLHFF